MKIYIVSGVGHGRTNLSAFDAALQDCGVANYNIVLLSSIIPPGSVVVQDEACPKDLSHYGDRLYVAKAVKRSSEKDIFIGAGIGWYQYDDGRGLFVEHHASGDSEKEIGEKLAADIRVSAEDLCRFRNIPFSRDALNMKVKVTEVKGKPTCVIAMAVVCSEKWR